MTTAERRDGREWKRIELQLDTAQILIVLAMLFGLCATSFYLGRWIERDRWSETTSKTSAAAPKVVDSGAGDLTFFDTLGKGTAEPSRQVRAGSAAAASAGPAAGTARNTVAPSGNGDAAEGSDLEPAGPPKSASSAPGRGAPSSAAPASSPPAAHESPSLADGPSAGSGAAPGGYAIQVFAGDKSQAEKVASSLTHKGYAARVVAGTAAGKARVRIVGYRSKTDATAAAARLKKEANLKPWVLKAD